MTIIISTRSVAIHCPKCSARIEYLARYTKCEKKHAFYSVDHYEYLDEFELDSEPLDFECPECQEVLFHEEEQAHKFMAWGDLYPWKGVDDYGQKD